MTRLSHGTRTGAGSSRARASATGRTSSTRRARSAPESAPGTRETAGVLTVDRPAAPGTRPRRPRQQVRRWPWILGAALAVALVVATGVVVFFTPLLGLRSVVITAGSAAGADRTAVAGGTLDPTLDDAIRAAVGVPDGTPLARIDLSAIAGRVQDVPQVDAVDVARSWPNAVTVTVTPRVPVAVTSANGRWWLMDARGVAYLPVAAPPAGLVTLKLATPGPGDAATEAAMSVIGSFTDSFRGQVAAVSARTAYDVRLTLTDGRTVVWGDADASPRKMQVLPALLEREGSEYDVTDPSLVSVR